MSDLNLETHFPDASREDWLALVEKGLRGATLESLTSLTEDGLTRGPLMSAQDRPDTTAPLSRAEQPLLDGRPWHMAAPVRDPDVAHANQQLLDDLKGGASAVRIEAGTVLEDRSDLKRLLESVFTDLVPIQFAPDAGNAAKIEIVQSIKALQTAHMQLGLDPIQDAEIIENSLKNTPENWRLMALASAAIHEYGGTDVQELSGMAASLADAMRRHGADKVCRHLVIELSADRDAHLSIAKFRAARRIILRIADGFGADGTSIPLHAVTSLRMMQTTDAWTNMLRIMSAGFGAIVGGADMVTLRPFTDGLGKATPFAHRIARNMQLLMMEESHLGQVADAAYGSFWHENMTEQLAQAAWTSFQKIEDMGGIESYLDSGAFKAELDRATSERAERNDPILGVTLHPAESVKTPEVRT